MGRSVAKSQGNVREFLVAGDGHLVLVLAVCS